MECLNQRGVFRVKRVLHRTIVMMALSFTLPFLASSGSVLAQDYNPSTGPGAKGWPSLVPAKTFRSKVDPSSLERSAYDSFQRSLMPLGDYLTYLSMARDIRLAQADPESKEAQIAAWQQYINGVRAVRPALERFQQPAAARWQAEKNWAQLAEAQAMHRLAIMSENRDAIDAAQAQQQLASTQLLRTRREDYSMGTATLAELTHATDQFAQNHGYSSVEQMEFLQGAHDVAQMWNDKGAGIGRSDKVNAMQIHLGVKRLQKSIGAENWEEVATNTRQLSEVAESMYQTGLQRHLTGTTSLHQLTKAMLLRQRLQTLSESRPELKETINSSRLTQDWDQLDTVALRSTDLRGRMTADVQAVRLLSEVRQSAVQTVTQSSQDR